MENKILSIIVSVYNAEKFLPVFFQSFNREYLFFSQLIFVDGNSTDRSLEIINLNKESFDCIVVSEPDKGIYDAMNKGIKLASTPYVYFLGVDDELVINPTTLLNILKCNSGEVIYGNVEFVKQGSVVNIVQGSYNLRRLIRGNICHQAIFYPRNCFKHRNYNLKYRFLADYEFNMYLWQKTPNSFKYVNETIAKYSIEGQSSTVVDHQFKSDSLTLVFNYFGMKGLAYKFLNLLNKM